MSKKVRKLVRFLELNSNVIKTKYLYNCIQSLDLMNQHQMELIPIPGHQVIEENEKADEYAVIGSSLDETMAYNDFQTSLIVVAIKIDYGALGETI